MKRFYMMLAVAALVVSATAALATPPINSAVLKLNIWEDCLFHSVTTDNSYPGQIWIDDAWTTWPCGWADLHNWRLSTDGTTAAVFNNGDGFRLAAVLELTGVGYGESGLQISPWWSQDVDGRLNVRTPDGEIACFGGRLPFYTFTGFQGVAYAGGPILLEVIYLPNGLSLANPATITYNIEYPIGTPYTSGPLPFDEGNPGEGYGSWGMLDNARVGAHLQALIGSSGQIGSVRATWSGIEFEDLGGPTAVDNSSWGAVKTLFR